MNRERGQSLVEFVLVIPIIMISCFGIFELGRMLAFKLTLESVAQEFGVRTRSTYFYRSRSNQFCEDSCEIQLTKSIKELVANPLRGFAHPSDISARIYVKEDPNRASVQINACLPFWLTKFAFARELSNRDCEGRWTKHSALSLGSFQIRVAGYAPATFSENLFTHGLAFSKKTTGLSPKIPDILMGAEKANENSWSRIVALSDAFILSKMEKFDEK